MTRAPLGDSFWDALEALLAAHPIVIERPRGSPHPRSPEVIYPLDDGCLPGVGSNDGADVDVWVGSDPARRIVGAILTADLPQRDCEIKVLIGCPPAEAQTLLAFHRGNQQRPLWVKREDIDL
jgi:inorganic pyrophosphatase